MSGLRKRVPADAALGSLNSLDIRHPDDAEAVCEVQLYIEQTDRYLRDAPTADQIAEACDELSDGAVRDWLRKLLDAKRRD